MHLRITGPAFWHLTLLLSALWLTACAADVHDADDDAQDDAEPQETMISRDALMNRAPPGDGTGCTVKDLGGGTHTGSSEQNGQWCCTPAGSGSDANTCYNCSAWSYTCTVKSAVRF